MIRRILIDTVEAEAEVQKAGITFLPSFEAFDSSSWKILIFQMLSLFPVKDLRTRFDFVNKKSWESKLVLDLKLN